MEARGVGLATGEPPTLSGLALYGMRLVGRTVRLAQTAGVRTADGIVSVTSKVLARSEGTEQVAHETEHLYARIGARLCELARADPALLPEDPRVRTLVSDAINGAAQAGGQEPARPARETPTSGTPAGKEAAREEEREKPEGEEEQRVEEQKPEPEEEAPEEEDDEWFE